jgi:predicted nuclease of restriction endonuclease-like (RecB) superfamily
MTRKQQAEYKKRKRKNLTIIKRHQKKLVKQLIKTSDVLHNLSIKDMNFPLQINIDHETNSLDAFKDFLQIHIDPYKNVSNKNTTG